MQKFSLKNTNDSTFRKFIENKQKTLRRSCTKENTSRSKKDISQIVREENISCKNFDLFFQKKHQNILKLSKTLQDMWQKQIDDIKILSLQVGKEKLVVKKIKRQRNLMIQKKKNLNQTLQNYQEEKKRIQEEIKTYQLQSAKCQRESKEVQLLYQKVQKIQNQLDLGQEISFNFVDQLKCLQQKFKEISLNSENPNLKKTIGQLQDLISEKSSNVFFNKLEKQIDQKYIEILSSKYQKLSFEHQEQNSQNLQSLYIQKNNQHDNSYRYSDCIYSNNKQQDESGEVLPMIFMDQSYNNNQPTKLNYQFVNNIQSPNQNFYSSQTRKTIDRKLKRQLTDFGKHQQSAYFRNNSVSVQKKANYSILQQSNFAEKKSQQEYQLLEMNWKKILKSFIFISSIVFENSDTLASIFLSKQNAQYKEKTLQFLNQTKKRQKNCKQYIEGYKKLREVSIQGLNSCIKNLISQLKTEKHHQNEFVQNMNNMQTLVYSQSQFNIFKQNFTKGKPNFYKPYYYLKFVIFIYRHELKKYKKYVHEDSKVKFKSVKAIYPPPGNNLIVPQWEVNKFFDKLGYGLKEYTDKFENLKDVIEATPEQLKQREIPARARRYLRMMIERLKRGVLTFEYLERRSPQVNKKDHQLFSEFYSFYYKEGISFFSGLFSSKQLAKYSIGLFGLIKKPSITNLDQSFHQQGNNCLIQISPDRQI